jgi:hypothetical protein
MDDRNRGQVGAFPFARAGERRATKCSVSTPIYNRKPYALFPPADKWPSEIAAMWVGAPHLWTELRNANYDFASGFELDNTGTCAFSAWAGERIMIPASWPDPPSASPLWNWIKKPDGTPYDRAKR